MFKLENELQIAKHLIRLVKSYESLSKKKLITFSSEDPLEVFKEIYHADFALVSHDNQSDPILNFANLKAQELWEMDFEEITKVPSRYTAEEMERSERDRLLAEVEKNGYIDSYSGIRISKSGKRFLIRNAKVWNVLGEEEEKVGQAAYFDDWEYL